MPEISVGIVNYRSTELLLGAVDTLLRDAVAAFGSVDAVDVAVVENASGDDSVAQLEARLPSGVKLVVNTLNAGYAKANNQAFAVTRGRLHLVLNPDCRVVSGMLAGLRDALDAHPEAGMVGPNVSMDEDGDVLLPPNEMVDPFVDALAHTTRTSDAVARWNARRRARFAHSVWKAVHPMPVPMLSGGCFMGRRSDFRRLGLFDAGYPLYYEDTDLFRRFVDAGMTLLQVPSVRVVHFFSRSAMQRPKATGWRNAVSARRYFERWFGAEGLATHDFFARAGPNGRGTAHRRGRSSSSNRRRNLRCWKWLDRRAPISKSRVDRSSRWRREYFPPPREGLRSLGASSKDSGRRTTG